MNSLKNKLPVTHKSMLQFWYLLKYKFISLRISCDDYFFNVNFRTELTGRMVLLKMVHSVI